MVVAAAGNVDHDGLVALVREQFLWVPVVRRWPLAVNGSPRSTLVGAATPNRRMPLGIRTPGRGWSTHCRCCTPRWAVAEFPAVRETRGLTLLGLLPRWISFADSGALVYAACPNASPT